MLQIYSLHAEFLRIEYIVLVEDVETNDLIRKSQYYTNNGEDLDGLADYFLDTFVGRLILHKEQDELPGSLRDCGICMNPR